MYMPVAFGPTLVVVCHRFGFKAVPHVFIADSSSVVEQSYSDPKELSTWLKRTQDSIDFKAKARRLAHEQRDQTQSVEENRLKAESVATAQVVHTTL